MTQPFPIPRQKRATDAFFGNGGSIYGPFSFQVFDVEDVSVYVKVLDSPRFEKLAVTVAKVSNLPLDFFTVDFSAPIASSTGCIVASERVPERSAGVSKGTRLDINALEKELSKIATVQQELRRDVERSVRSEFGSEAPVFDSDISDGAYLILRNGHVSEGASPESVIEAAAGAEANAAAALAAATAAAASAALAGTWDPTNYVYKLGNNQISGDLALKSGGSDIAMLQLLRSDGTMSGSFYPQIASGTIRITAMNAAGNVETSALSLGGAAASFTFNDNTVWHAGNFTPSDYVQKNGGDVTLTGVLKAKSIVVGEGQTASQIDMKDTNGLNRAILNDANYIGFLKSDGSWALRVSDSGQLYTSELGDINARIEARAAAYASSAANDRVGNLSYRLVNGGETAGTSAPSGAVMTGQRTVTSGGQNGTSTLYTAFAYPQVYDVVRGWVSFYSV